MPNASEVTLPSDKPENNPVVPISTEQLRAKIQNMSEDEAKIHVANIQKAQAEASSAKQWLQVGLNVFTGVAKLF